MQFDQGRAAPSGIVSGAGSTRGRWNGHRFGVVIRCGSRWVRDAVGGGELMAGRPPIPLELHKARGTDRTRVHNREKGCLQIDASSVGRCPAWLPREAKAEWKRITGHAEYGRVLSVLDRGALLDYCSLHAQMEAHHRDPVNNALSASDGQRLQSLRMQLGLTPASRSKVKAPTAKPKGDEWDVLAHGRKARAS